jgi:hypothetical protein
MDIPAMIDERLRELFPGLLGMRFTEATPDLV